MREIKKYQTSAGVEPFNEWFQDLNWVTQAKIDAYVFRAAGGATKNVKPVGRGVFEIVVDYGLGYRVYFGQVDGLLIVLLLGGSKRRQQKDIQQAIEYWSDYRAKNI